MKLSTSVFTIAVVLGATLGGGAFAYKFRPRPGTQAPATAVVISAPAAAEAPAPTIGAANFPPSPTASQPTPSPSPTTQAPLPASVLIKVPYTSQAPLNRWDSAHEEYCEAAASLMVGRFYGGDRRDAIPPTEADQAMGDIVAYERATFPGTLDLSLDQIAQVTAHFYGLTPNLRPATLDNVRASLAAGHPVIIPVMTHGGPGNTRISPHYGATDVYHVILLIGYDQTRVYANDPGFMQGQNWAYSWSVLDAAMTAQVPKTGQPKQMLEFTRQ